MASLGSRCGQGCVPHGGGSRHTLTAPSGPGEEKRRPRRAVHNRPDEVADLPQVRSLRVGGHDPQGGQAKRCCNLDEGSYSDRDERDRNHHDHDPGSSSVERSDPGPAYSPVHPRSSGLRLYALRAQVVGPHPRRVVCVPLAGSPWIELVHHFHLPVAPDSSPT